MERVFFRSAPGLPLQGWPPLGLKPASLSTFWRVGSLTLIPMRRSSSLIRQAPQIGFSFLRRMMRSLMVWDRGGLPVPRGLRQGLGPRRSVVARLANDRRVVER